MAWPTGSIWSYCCERGPLEIGLLGDWSMFLKSKEQLSKKRLIFLIAMALLLMTGALLFNAPQQTQVIEVQFPNGARLQAEVADTPEKLLFGLAFREFLPENEGMLFIFDTSGPHRIWTKGFQIPVDIIWVDESKQVVHLVKGAEPCSQDPCPFYGPPPENARYIIQTNVGFIRREGVTSGTELKFALRM